MKQQEKPQTDQKQHERQQFDTAIGRLVIACLGQPGDLQQVQVRRLWENRYRVNIFIGKDAASVRIANSYFLLADADGNIIESTPEITRQY